MEKSKIVTAELEQCTRKSADTGTFVSLVRNYTNVTELSPAILNEFIEKIIIHSADKSSGKRLQKIDIIYKGVGSVELKEE